jgi:hypothetical protein
MENQPKRNKRRKRNVKHEIHNQSAMIPELNLMEFEDLDFH